MHIDESLARDLGWAEALVHAAAESFPGPGQFFIPDDLAKRLSRWPLALDGIVGALERLKGAGLADFRASPYGSEYAVKSDALAMTPDLLRALRHRGIDRVRAVELARRYCQETRPEDRSVLHFVRCAVAWTGGAQRNSQDWRPPRSLQDELRLQGIPSWFLDSHVRLFLSRYNPERGGGDIEGNFSRYIAAAWSREKRPIPRAWLPSTECNERVMSTGITQMEALRLALEFRIAALERGGVSADWDVEFCRWLEGGREGRRLASGAQDSGLLKKASP